MKYLHCIIILGCVALFGLQACDSMNPDQLDCPSILIEKTIQVVDEQGSPFSGLELKITNKNSGQPLCKTINDSRKQESCNSTLGELDWNTGEYVIVSSINNAERGKDGDVNHRDTIEVTGLLDAEELFIQEYIVVMDDIRCHPERLIGPLEVVVERPVD